MTRRSRFLTLLFFFLAHLTLNAAVYNEPTPQFKPRFEIAALYIEDGDKILLLHRQDNKSQGNKWGIPAGKVDKGETPLQAVIREVLEETGYDFSAQPIEYLSTVYVEHNPKDHIVYHMFRTQMVFDPKAIRINPLEHKDYRRITPCKELARIYIIFPGYKGKGHSRNVGFLNDRTLFLKRPSMASFH